ncbi:MAG: hypothetical protein A2X86_06665 [Bdellovibrionales bacterium GWA2_49_15]|nr:MAG: hypothetical protein A2X86_06665 [Bdellovibrionales bacterium GWA2_49_15]HAZ12045.1 hypothetical protein [Bdellovibrionales bacterium]
MSIETVAVSAPEIVLDVPVQRVKNFRELPDIENFYRFIYENDLRRETKMLLESIWTAYIKRKKQQRKAEARH